MKTNNNQKPLEIPECNVKHTEELRKEHAAKKRIHFSWNKMMRADRYRNPWPWELNL